MGASVDSTSTKRRSKKGALVALAAAGVFGLTGCYEYFADVTVNYDSETETFAADVVQTVTMPAEGISEGGYMNRLTDLAGTSSTSWPESQEDCEALVEEYSENITEELGSVPASDSSVEYVDDNGNLGCEFSFYDVPLGSVGDVVHPVAGTSVSMSHSVDEGTIAVTSDNSDSLLVDEFERFDDLPAVAEPSVGFGFDMPGDIVSRSEEGDLLSERHYDESFDIQYSINDEYQLVPNDAAHLITYDTEDVLSTFTFASDDGLHTPWWVFVVIGMSTLGVGVLVLLVIKRVRYNRRPVVTKFNENYTAEESSSADSGKSSKDGIPSLNN